MAAVLPAWVLSEPVDVTLVYESLASGVGVYLVSRPDARSSLTEPVVNAVTLTRTPEGILVNGLAFEESVENEYWDLLSLIEAAGELPVGVTVRSAPDAS